MITACNQGNLQNEERIFPRNFLHWHFIKIFLEQNGWNLFKFGVRSSNRTSNDWHGMVNLLYMDRVQIIWQSPYTKDTSSQHQYALGFKG